MIEADFSIVRGNGTLPDPTKIDTSDVIEELWEAYRDSSNSFLSELEAAALAIEAGNNIEENSAHIRRILHSMKGEAGMCGLMDINKLCHEAEFAFEELADTSQAAEMVLKVKDWIDEAIQYISAHGLTPDKKTVKTEQPKNTRNQQKLKTLVIEDDSVCSKRLAIIIEGYCDCTFAVNGRQGLELFKKAHKQSCPFQVITLDIQMPEMDGHETLKAIRKFENRQGIKGLDGVKVIMTTVQSENEHIVGAFRQGCEAYVVKPLGDNLLDEMTKLGLLQPHKTYAIK